VRENVRKASTEDLLDRVTVERAEMEAEALDIIEEELRSRKVGPEDIWAHAQQRMPDTIRRGDGTLQRCSFCARPAVAFGWGWHRVLRVLPLLPRRFAYCEDHRP
jgi:hypothetical protein